MARVGPMPDLKTVRKYKGMSPLETIAAAAEVTGEVLGEATATPEVEDTTEVQRNHESTSTTTAPGEATAVNCQLEQFNNGGTTSNGEPEMNGGTDDGRNSLIASMEEEEEEEVRRRPVRRSSLKNKENRRDSWTSSRSDESENENESHPGTSESKDENDPPSSNTDSTTPMTSSSTFKKRKWKRKEYAGSAAQKRSKMNMNPFNRPPLNVLKRTGESFLQDDSCTELVAGGPKLGKCRECRLHGTKSDKQNKIICRFYAFRKLKYTKSGSLVMAGFSNSITDPKKEDLELWLPSKDIPPKSLDLELAKFIIDQVGDQFCELIQQENEVFQLRLTEDSESEDEDFVAWKRVVGGIREMCDVCDTTLFNFHWACRKCGFAACISCYRGRKQGIINNAGRKGIDRDEFRWLFCSSTRAAHTMQSLMLTQCIGGKALTYLGNLLHRVRAVWSIPQECGCEEAKSIEGHNISHVEAVTLTPIPAKINVGTAHPMELDKNDSDEDEEDEEGFAALAAMLTATTPVTVDYGTKNEVKVEPKEFPSTASGSMIRRRKEPPAVLSYALTATQVQYPNVPHSWLTYGKLLHLHDPSLAENQSLFQEVWLRGQPVLVSRVADQLKKSLWTPESFLVDFHDLKHDLVNCVSGRTLANQPLKKFWEGFEYVEKRLKDEKGNPMLLKLKDWPPGEDFAESLPSRFYDLMSCLPLKEYTQRTGRLNLAARLPEKFVRPDLGPKMYIAYGSGLHLNNGTTNLHLDISDAVNLMVHIGVPKDVDNEEDHKAVLAAIEDSDVDGATIDRVRDGELPGALWHIYNSKDAAKIRDLLNKVAVERGTKLEAKHDPIHDQHWYLDKGLRARLVREYNCVGFPLVQFEGDAVFIPAGAPHQVRNLHNCIKIAEDFVSPENVSHCLGLTEEFRDLTETHSNHEDKLQIKNIIYHAVKDAVSVLYQHMSEKQRKECDEAFEDPLDGVIDEQDTGVKGPEMEEEGDKDEDEKEAVEAVGSQETTTDLKMDTGGDPVTPIAPCQIDVLNMKLIKNEQERTQIKEPGLVRDE